MPLVPDACYRGGVSKLAGLTSPALGEGGEALRRRLSVLVAMVVMLAMTLASGVAVTMGLSIKGPVGAGAKNRSERSEK
jgi:hypothetical protein